MSTAKYVFFMGKAKSRSKFEKFIDDNGRDSGPNSAIVKLFDLEWFDHDGIDYHYWDDPVSRDEAVLAAKDDRYKQWPGLPKALENGFEHWAGPINCLVSIQNTYSPWELHPGRILTSKTYGDFLFITPDEGQWGKDTPEKYTVQSRSHYIDLLSIPPDSASDEDIYNAILIEAFVAFGNDAMREIITGEFESDLDIGDLYSYLEENDDRAESLIQDPRYAKIVQTLSRP